MTVSIDSQVFDIQVALDAGGVTRAGFGVPMLVASSANLEAGFTERVRTYNSAGDVADDEDLTAAISGRLNAMFAQNRAPSPIKVGRREADAAQVNTFTVVDTTDGDYTITLNGVDYTFAASGNTAGEIRNGLVSAINAGSEPVTAANGGGTDDLTVTADVAGTPFSTATASPDSGITEVETTANVSVATELDAILAADSDFFHIVLDTRVALDVSRAADFAATNRRILWAQLSDSDIVTSATTDQYSTLASESNRWVVPLYYSDDDDFFDARFAAFFAANDFDSEAPTAAFNTLAGLAADPGLTSTQQANLIAKGVAYYATLKGSSSTPNSVQVSAGFDVALVVTGAWVEARISEAIASLFRRRANSGARVPYTDLGFRSIDGEALAVLKSGERIGHFVDDTSEIDGTLRADASAADVSAGIYRFDFGAQYTGLVKSVTIRGTVSTNFEGFGA